MSFKLLDFTKAKFLREGGLMLVAKAIQQGGNLYVGIWIAKILTESDYGVYRLLMAIVSYLPFANLGVAQTIVFKLPDAFRKKSITEIKNVTSVFNSFLLITRLFLLLLFVVLAIFQVKINQQTLDFEWLLLGLLTVFSGWNLLFINIFKSDNKFKEVSYSRSINSLVYLAVVVCIAKGLQINGILIALIAGTVLSFIYGIYYNKKYLSFRYNFKQTVDYIKFGFPIILNTLVWILFSSSILWVVSAFYPPDYTGIFGFALVIATIFKVMPGIIIEMVSPKLISYLGVKEINLQNEKRLITDSIFSLSLLNFVFAVASLFLFKLLITYYVAKYSSTWPMVIFLILGYHLYNISSLINVINLKRGRASIILVINIVSLCIQLVVAFAIIELEYDFYLIAIAPAVGLMISSIGGFWTAYFSVEDKTDYARDFVKISFLGISTSGFITIYWYLLFELETPLEFLKILLVGLLIIILPGFLGVRSLKKYLKMIS